MTKAPTDVKNSSYQRTYESDYPFAREKSTSSIINVVLCDIECLYTHVSLLLDDVADLANKSREGVHCKSK